MTDTARKHGIYEHIRFDRHVRSAQGNSATDIWTVLTDDGAAYQCRFVFFATGYYNYDEGYTPEIPGIEQFGGQLIHPQHWPTQLDYTGKTIVVIGSGATAITLVPSLADRAGKVIMLQRTPSYIGSFPRIDALSQAMRKVLSIRAFHAAARLRMALQEAFGWFLSRKAPALMKYIFRRMQTKRLPDGYDIGTHFNPPYQPWDQRICLAADGDFFDAINDGSVEVVTDHIDQFEADGIALRSGRHLDADIVVTATGLQLQALGGVEITIDGAQVKPQDRFAYKAHMLEDVPNLFWCVGYTNASWTLRADMTARATAKLIAYMRKHGHTSAYPARAPQVRHETSVERAAQLLRRRCPLPAQSGDGGDGVRLERENARRTRRSRWPSRPGAISRMSAAATATTIARTR
jgi:cation diffusion facilitator CzcD-associated flavoprotein CzcO